MSCAPFLKTWPGAGTAFSHLTVGKRCAICHNSFPHFADKATALLNLGCVLRAGGHLLILHDLSREKVNAIHSNGGVAIQNDLLPPGKEAGQMLVRAGFGDVWVEDNDEHYVVAACREIQTGPSH